MKTYQARYKSSKNDLATYHNYRTQVEAQVALMRVVGDFHLLGTVAGDSISTDVGYCNEAPRNGGLVSITEREV